MRVTYLRALAWRDRRERRVQQPAGLDARAIQVRRALPPRHVQLRQSCIRIVSAPALKRAAERQAHQHRREWRAERRLRHRRRWLQPDRQRLGGGDCDPGRAPRSPTPHSRSCPHYHYGAGFACASSPLSPRRVARSGSARALSTATSALILTVTGEGCETGVRVETRATSLAATRRGRWQGRSCRPGHGAQRAHAHDGRAATQHWKDTHTIWVRDCGRKTRVDKGSIFPALAAQPRAVGKRNSGAGTAACPSTRRLNQRGTPTVELSSTARWSSVAGALFIRTWRVRAPTRAAGCRAQQYRGAGREESHLL